jgi:hypothetical protein
MSATDAWDDRQMWGTGDLAVFLGGSETSFTGLLIVLIQKADPGNLARLRLAFPREVRAWETWNAMSPCPTPRHLLEALAEAAYIAEHGSDDLETGHTRDPEGDEAAHA